MNSRVSWSVDGIDPNVRERAEAAARRAGMSLNDWINSTLGQSSIVQSSLPQSSLPQSSPPQSSLGAPSLDHSIPPNYRTASPEREAREVADIHQRLDLITRQIERIARPAPRPEPQRGEQGVAHQLNEAISRLDARLSQISNPAPARQSQLQEKQRLSEMVERAADQIYRSSPPLSPASLDLAVAEIAARQNELDNAAPAQTPPRSPPPIVTGPATRRPIAPAMQAAPDFSALERHLFKITSQIEALQKPDGIESSIAGFRSELAEIRQALTEAMPRRAIESIESEVRALSRRIEDNSQSSTDVHALAGIQSALGEIREVLKSLTPAEQLAGYDEAIRNLGAKLDLILRANDNPGTVRQLETAIAALRNIVSNIASNDALARLSNDVHLLSSKVDQLTRAGDNTDSFAILEQRIAALTSTLQSREQPSGQGSERFEGAVQALSDRLDRMPVANDSASAFAHLEQRVSYLLERIEASGERGGNLGQVEESLQDILRHLESQHATFTAFAENSRNASAPQPPDSDIVDLVKRELSDIRFSQSKTERQTQDSLEVVHNTLGHVVDRLAMIEGDLRSAHFAPPPQPSAATAFEAPPATYRAATPLQPRPELPNPAAAEAYFAAAPREFHAVQTPAPPIAPVANTDILEPEIAQSLRAALQPDLPPDHPLEPGTRPSARSGSPSERIAASESVISEIPAAPREPVNSSSFIAAARRAAQAAAAAQPAEKSGRVSTLSSTGGKAMVKKASGVTSKIRSLLIVASVVVIVLSGFKTAMTLLDGSSGSQLLGFQNSSEPPASTQSPADSSASPGSPDPTSSMTSPTPIGRQSNNTSGTNTLDTASLIIPRTTAPITSTSDITGSIPAPSGKLAMVQVPPTERLPDGIGGAMLRAAALKGDPAAAYEIALRFAEGNGIAPNLEEAAKWYDRAAQAGMVPAVFRLGTLYEKGLGVNKDTDIARRYYLQAAGRGNAKAMHNLAVLDADGGGKGADYISASQWFRKAAERGVADSQFNLGILFARGIGVEQNLAESFKWFSLAATQGDADAGRKRDEIAKRLDAQSLAAANLAVQTFTPEPQPDDAINVGTPAGGWDSAPASATVTKPAAKQAFKRAAALH